MSAVLDTPRFENAKLRAVASGWRLSPIFRVLAGNYMTITTSQDRALTAITQQRVDQILASPYGNKTARTISIPRHSLCRQWDRWATPERARFADRPVGSLMRPSPDIPVPRNTEAGIPCGGVQHHEQRPAEQPDHELNSNTFGQINSAQDPRIMQFALKYVF